MIQRTVLATVVTLVLLAPMVALALAAAGIFIPTLLLTDGTDKYSGEEKAFASYALHQAYFWFDNPFENLLSLKVRVVSVDRIDDGTCEIYTPDHPQPFHIDGEWVAQVGEYTFLGIPFRFVEIHCIDYYTSPN